MLVASILKQVFSNRNVLAISTTNMLYQIFNGLWQLWWTLYLIDELNTPIYIVGLLATIQSGSSILFQLPGGILADRIGRKKVIIFGTGLRVIAPIFLFTARSWQWVVPGVILNATTSLYMPAFNALIAESLPKERRGTAFGAYRMMTSIPGIFMPVVSGYYLEVMGVAKGVRIGLMMFTVAALIATVVRAIFLEETFDPQARRTEASKEKSGSDGLWATFKRQHKTVYAMLGVAIISRFAMNMTWTFLSYYAVDVLNLTTTQYGMLQSVATLISTPLFLVSGMIADRFGRMPCILLARGLGPFDSLSLLLIKNYNQLLAAYSVIGVAGGLGGGRIRGGGYMGGPAWQALITDIVPQADRGKVLGLMGTITGIASLPGPAIGGYLYESNPNALLALGAGLEALVIPMILLFVKEPKREEKVSQ
jgi:MFS family permease